MDTSKYFYYWATGLLDLHETPFDGVDFHGGLSSLTLEPLKGHVFEVDASGQRQLTGKLIAQHVQRYGHLLYLYEQEMPQFPCLLTTDPEIRWVYSGPVHVSTNNSNYDANELLDPGIPLRGRNWLGLLHRVDNKPWIDAYATQSEPWEQPAHAFYPDWHESLEDEDVLIFTIEKAN